MTNDHIINYNKNPSICKYCTKMLNYKKRKNRFCNNSCAASFNNKGIRRHGNDLNECLMCGEKTKRSGSIYCGVKCSSQSRITSKRAKQINQNIRSQKYRARLKNAIASDANIELIRLIYEHCPKGYHVDHIIPLNKGGHHHENNLQYLPSKINMTKKDNLDFDDTHWRINPITYINEKGEK